MEKQGWVKLYRQSLDSTVWINPIILAVWVWCLLKANHKESKFPFNGKDIIVKAGEFITGINKAVMELPDISPQQYRTAIKYLISTNRITKKATNKFTLISVVNWGKYQDDNNQSNKRITTEQQTNNNLITTYKNDKNDKNVKKEKEKNLQATPAEQKISVDNENISEKKEGERDKPNSEESPKSQGANSETPPPPVAKSPHSPESKQTISSAQIVEIIDIFRKTNKAIKYENKTEREAITNLIQEEGFQEVKKWAEYAVSIQGKDKFAPRITTPHNLWTKLTKLKNYKSTNNSDKSYEKSNTTSEKYNKYSKKSSELQ